jgi:hypothetical protein
LRSLIIAARIFIISFAADEFICRSLRPEFFYFCVRGG